MTQSVRSRAVHASEASLYIYIYIRLVICNGIILAFDWMTHFVTFRGKVLTFRLAIQTPL